MDHSSISQDGVGRSHSNNVTDEVKDSYITPRKHQDTVEEKKNIGRPLFAIYPQLSFMLLLVQNSCRVSAVLEVSCRVGPPTDLNAGSCTRAREVMIFCTIKSKPLALPWGRTPRLDSGVRVSNTRVS
ncbi:hypothetical protein Tco_0962943 [Tanacetum coccineum]